MKFAPTNELGVVFLFSDYARKHRIHIEEIKAGFPDCIAYRIEQGKRKRIRIEFEYKSKNFSTHRHDPRQCDWIVCWEHNWPEAPENLTVIELRREYGLGFNVWIVPMDGNKYENRLNTCKSDRWSVPIQCHKDDLVLVYLKTPYKCIKHIFKANERAKLVAAAGWKKGSDIMGELTQVCTLDSPIFLEDLQNHRIIKTAGFVRAQMQGRHNAMAYWSYLYDLIIRKNPSAKKKLSKYLKY